MTRRSGALSVPEHGRRVQPQPPRQLRALALHSTGGAQRGRDRPDVRGLLRGHLGAVPRPRPPGRFLMSVTEDRSWTGRVRRRAVDALPPERLLPDKQPSYVASWIYIF